MQLPCRLQHTDHPCVDLAEPAPTPSFWGSALCLVHLQARSQFPTLETLLSAHPSHMQDLWIQD